MKKILSNIYTLAALFMMGAATFTSCSGDDAVVEQKPEQPANGKYTMTVQASKGMDTRALTIDDGATLNATWTDGEEVTVYEGENCLGTLSATNSDEATCTLTGELDDAPTGSEVTLKFNAPTYTEQEGTLDYIASHCDYATATTTVTVSGKTITGTDVEFTNQQAIVKYTLRDNASTPASLSATGLVVNDGENDYTITLGSAASEIYVAIPHINDQTVTLTATVGSDTYTYTKSNVTFRNGEYYEIAVKMTKQYKMAAAATTADYGMVVCAAGHLHTAKTAVPSGCTAVGILGKVTSTGHGLILALQDATAQTWNTINGWSSVTTYASTALKLLPDNTARGANLTSYTTLGSTTVSNWAVAQKSDYEAIFANLGSTTGDYDGKTFDANVNAYITTRVGGTAISGGHWSATATNDDYARIFRNDYWFNYQEKTTILSVRPVLAF
ncbi:MAG: hypothetical protein J6T38_11015 [Bacteroidaceae bacterium]|nr:hypothetical protein [Bacteroidaceae bacterium]